MKHKALPIQTVTPLMSKVIAYLCEGPGDYFFLLLSFRINPINDRITTRITK